MIVSLWIILLFVQADVPLKSSEEFECKLDLSFKPRSYNSSTVVDFSETVAERDRRLSTSPLPYLKIKVSFIKLAETEIKAVVWAGGDVMRSKKITEGDDLLLELGFTDDIKDGILPREYQIVIQSKDRQPVSRILLSFTKEGDYLVNGVKRGRI